MKFERGLEGAYSKRDREDSRFDLHESPRNYSRTTIVKQFEIKVVSESGIQFDPHIHIVQNRSYHVSISKFQEGHRPNLPLNFRSPS